MRRRDGLAEGSPGFGGADDLVLFLTAGNGFEEELREVADSAHIDEASIRSFFGKGTAQSANHRGPGLPSFLRLSTRIRDSSYAGERHTVAYAVTISPDESKL